MSQHDLVIENQVGADFRPDVQAALRALASLQGGTSAPTTTYPHMLWYDEDNDIIMIRNTDDDEWLPLTTLVGDGADGPGYLATSDSSVEMAEGELTFATQSNLAYIPAQRVRVVHDADNYVEGPVVSYDGDELVIDVDRVIGSGTYDDWAVGLTGEPGSFNWRGVYDSGTAYSIGDAVSHEGSSYYAIAATTGNDPPNLTYWDIFAAKGDAGDPGVIAASDVDNDSAVTGAKVSDALNSLKTYIDGVATELTNRTRVRAATTVNVTIATALNNGDTLDGVTLATNDMVLVKNQSAPAENGIYVVGAESCARAAIRYLR